MGKQRRRGKGNKVAVDPMVAWKRDFRGIWVWSVISVAVAGGIAWIVNLFG